MAEVRKTFQGVGNVVRFNRHFYLFAAITICAAFILSFFAAEPLKLLILLGGCAALLTTAASLAVSFYVYDLAGIYDLNWIKKNAFSGTIININAGFDEISGALAEKFPAANLIVADFYDAAKHTEISIERARKIYPPFPATRQIGTTKMPFADESAAAIFLFFAAHEIRDESEKEMFFNELNRCLDSDGEIYVVEHLRDTANFLAYNIGFLHFFSKKSWRRIFVKTRLVIVEETKLTPFVSLFTLKKNGNTP